MATKNKAALNARRLEQDSELPGSILLALEEAMAHAGHGLADARPKESIP